MNPCDCTIICGDDPGLRDGSAKPCATEIRAREAAERERHQKELAKQAFRIADTAMRDRLQEYAVRADEIGVCWGLVDDNEKEVGKLQDACAPLREAVMWLIEREQCELVEDPNGAIVLIFDV